ncbi:MAG: hypothetical protein HY756_01070 [Nitrospirae bacterium]|nr:hypothetical protein [Nitrospirota bacterium]
MRTYTIEELKDDENFLKNIRWDITPKKFLKPAKTDKIDGVMLYVETGGEHPVLMIMKNYSLGSVTAGNIEGIPNNLIDESASSPECISGMCPLSTALQGWLKKELGLLKD